MATKTYVLLSSIPTGNSPGQTPIKSCSAILENKLQCWNASAFVVKTLRDGKPFEYQLCRRHAMIEQATPDTETQKALSTTSDAAEVKIDAKPVEAEKTATRVISDSTSSFKPAPAKQKQEPKLEDIQSEVDRKVATSSSESTPAAKPLLAPKTPKPAAF